MTKPLIEAHHQRGLDALLAWWKPRDEAVAAIVGGSLAKGFGDRYCDLDLILICREEDFEQRRRDGHLILYSEEFCDYPGGYVDAKIVGPSFLRAAADRGSEPCRSAFTNAWVEWSRDDSIEEMVRAILVYPEMERERKIQRFVSELIAMKWFAGEGARKDSLYLLTRTASRTALFAARLILAHNRVLYPYHKWFLKELERAPEKPEGIVEDIHTMLRERTVESIHRVADSVLTFRDWPEPPNDWGTRFLLECEWNWMEGEAPLEDC